MKFDVVNDETRKNFLGKIVTFNKEINSHEADVDEGMKGRIIAFRAGSDESFCKIIVELKEFEAHNDPLMQPTYYDKEGKPTLTWKETGKYDGKETIYYTFGTPLPFDVELSDEDVKRQKIQKLAKEYRPSMNTEVLHHWAAELVALLKE